MGAKGGTVKPAREHVTTEMAKFKHGDFATKYSNSNIVETSPCLNFVGSIHALLCRLNEPL